MNCDNIVYIFFLIISKQKIIYSSIPLFIFITQKHTFKQASMHFHKPLSLKSYFILSLHFSFGSALGILLNQDPMSLSIIPGEYFP